MFAGIKVCSREENICNGYSWCRGDRMVVVLVACGEAFDGETDGEVVDGCRSRGHGGRGGEIW